MRRATRRRIVAEKRGPTMPPYVEKAEMWSEVTYWENIVVMVASIMTTVE